MRKFAFLMLMMSVLGLLLLNGCRPPEVEGTVINIQKGLYDDALASAKLATEKYPENAEAWFYWGWLNAEQKQNYEVMNQAFDKVMELSPEQEVSYEGTKVAAKDAIKSYRQQKFANFFNSAIKIVNESQELAEDERMQNLKEAQEKFLLAKQVAPERTEYYRPLAVTYISMEDTAQALKILNEGIEQDPDNKELLNLAGDLYLQKGELEKAEEIYLKAKEALPDDADLLHRLGQLEYNRENYEKATQYYEQAIELDPENANLAFNIGLSLYNQEDYIDAIPYFKKVVELVPDDEQAYRILANCYAQAKMIDEGLEFTRQAVEQFPMNAELHEYLGIFYGQKGMKDKANEAYNKSKELAKMKQEQQ